MGLRRKLVSGGGMLMGGQVLGQTCGFLRNVLVARLISPENFGIAATLSISMSMLEMISNLAVDRLLVQADDGDNSDFQAMAHFFQVIRGTCLALALFALAWPFALLFELPEAVWAFQCVAVIPFIRGFVHLDPKRLQRGFGFGADVITDLIPQFVLVLLAWPFAWWFRDYAAMVWLLIVQATVMVAVSHLVAKRRYAWTWNRAYFDRMCAYGWPLLLNGLLLFLILQGDRLIVGTAYDMVNLGVYSAAFSITFIPSTMIAKVASALLLPLLSKEQGNSPKFVEYYTLSICVLCLVGVVVSSGFILIGQRVVMLTFGAKYAAVETYIGWMAIMQMLRVLRVGPTIAAMAWGDTRTPLMSNIGRASVFPIAVWIGLSGKPIVWIVVIGCLGEFIAYLMMLYALKRSRGLGVGYSLKPTMIGGGAIFTAVLLSATFNPTENWMFALLGLPFIGGGAFVAMVYWIPACRPRVVSLLQSEFSRGVQE